MDTMPSQRKQGWFAANRFGAERLVVDDGVHVLRLTGDLDIGSSETAIALIRRGIAPPARAVLLDLSGVTFCSSSGLRVLVLAAGHATEQDIELFLVGAGRPVLRPMEITGLGTRFHSYPTIDAALAARSLGSGDPPDI